MNLYITSLRSDEKEYNLCEVKGFKTQFKDLCYNQKSFLLRDLLLHNINIHPGFLCGKKPVPGPVLRRLVEELIVSDPSLVNGTIDCSYFKPLEFLARYGNKGFCFYNRNEKKTTVCLYQKPTKNIKLQRTQKMAKLFLKHGAKMTLNTHRIATDWLMLKCASKKHVAIFDPKQQ